mgnify:FL=1
MATKNKGPLTKVEKFYIDNNQNQPVKELATDLSRTEKAVQKYLDTLGSDDTEHIAKSKSDAPSVGDMMIKNEKYGVSVMTQEASMAGETPPKQKKKFDPNVMHKIKDD